LRCVAWGLRGCRYSEKEVTDQRRSRADITAIFIDIHDRIDELVALVDELEGQIQAALDEEKQ